MPERPPCPCTPRVLRVLVDPLLVLLDLRGVATVAAEEVAPVALQQIAEARRARADAEEDEASGEDHGEQDEHPLGVRAQLREEHRVFHNLLSSACGTRPALDPARLAHRAATISPCHARRPFSSSRE